MNAAPLTLAIVTPCPRRSCKGNRITALRWAGLLRQLGHRVHLAETWSGEGGAGPSFDALLALHAFKSAESVDRFRSRHPERPVVVLLTGTDFAGGPDAQRVARATLAAADRIAVLQPQALEDLPPALREKSRVVRQSARPPRSREAPADDAFEVAVVGHLRDVKDPLRAAWSVRRLPPGSRLRVVHVGEALTEAMHAAATQEQAGNPRYRWLGKLTHARSVERIARSRALLLTSRSEGGANVVSEAIACGVPVLSSRIPGSIGILGAAYPGYFEVGDDASLARLLARFEADAGFRGLLETWCRRLAPLVAPERERETLGRLLDELLPGRGLPAAHGTETGEPARWTTLGTAEEPPFVQLAEDVAQGLTRQPKALSCRFFYDEAGSRLFEEICALPEYYVTRAEDELLEHHAADIAAALPAGTTLIELGSGSATKTRRLLDALLARQRPLRYVMIDISRAALEASAQSLLARYPGLDVVTIAAEYRAGLARLREVTRGPRLLLWLGSNIGNFHRPDAVAFLRDVAARIERDDRLLVGIDLRKDPRVLLPAYADAAGVTARFNKNLLARINEELQGDFDLDAFRHEATWDEAAGRIEMWLVSTRAQRARIRLLDLEVELAAGERLHTEDSYKYSPAEIEALATASGFALEAQWFDRERRFCDSLLAPRGAVGLPEPRP